MYLIVVIIKIYTQDGMFRVTRNFYKDSVECAVCTTRFPGGAAGRLIFRCPCCPFQHCVLCAFKNGLRRNRNDFTYLNFGYHFRKYHKCPICARCINVGNGDYVRVT